jgi:predicted ATP-grasp superfamily ATP-dependent carboligase
MNQPAKAPVHLWIVAALGTVWNGFGALDYTMTQAANEAWMAQMTAAQQAWLDAAPAWANAAWAFGVWGGLAGSLLLFVRSRHAVTAFILSLAGLAANTAFQASSPMPAGAMTANAQLGLHLAVWTGAIALLLYALAMRRRGVLRR